MSTQLEATYLGVEIGGTKLQIVVGDRNAAIISKERHTVARDAGALGIRERIASSVAKIRSRSALTAVGVGFGGPVDRKAGVTAVSHQIGGWNDFPIRSWIEGLAGCPVAIDNDANTAALAEALKGAGAACERVFYVTLGSGVGGGMVVHGEIYHGAPPGEAELGLSLLDRDGTTVESRCSGWAVDARVRSACERTPSSVLSRLSAADPGSEARHLSAALAAGDPDAGEIMRSTADDLAFGLSHAVHLFHPDIVVLGGGLSLIGEPLCRAVGAALENYVTRAFRPAPQVVSAALSEDVVCVGALLLALGAINPASP